MVEPHQSDLSSPSVAVTGELPPEVTLPPDDLPLATRIVRGGASVAVTSYGLLLFGFTANLILTRLLTPGDFGIYSLGFFFFSLLNLRPKLGVDQAFAHIPQTDAQSSGTFAILSISAGASSVLLALIVVPILFLLGYQQAVIWVTLVLAAFGMSDAIMAVAWVQLDKALLFSRVSLITALAFPLAYVPAFYLALHGGGYWALVAQNATYSVLLLIGLWWTARRYLSDIWGLRWTFSSMLAKRFLRFGVVVGFATLAASLLYQFDNFLVGTFVGIDTLGFYDRAYRIAQWPSLLISGVLTRTAFYAYSQLQNDLVRLTKTVTMSLWIVTTLALPVALAIFVSADDLVLLLFGDKWLPSAVFVRFLVLYSILRPLLDDAGSLFVAIGKPRRTSIVTLAQAIALIVAATPLTLAYNAIGTAIGVGLAFVVGLVVTYYFVRRTLPTFKLWDAFAVPVVATIASLSAYLLFAYAFDFEAVPLAARVVVKVSIAVFTFFAATYLLRPAVTTERAAYVWRLFRNRPV